MESFSLLPDPAGQRRLFDSFAPILEIDVASGEDKIGIPVWKSDKTPVIDTSKPTVYRQVAKNFATVPIQVGKQNDDDVIVTGGLKEGDVVTLESPADAAKRAKKKL